MDLVAVRTFVAVADTGQFQHAATELVITQQAVSKRIAALEKDLGTRLFTRTPRGAVLTSDGQAFLPHAHALLQAEQRARASVCTARLRVDMLGRSLAPAALLRDFHQAHPEIDLDVVTLFGADKAIAAVQAGTVDATVRAVASPLPDGLQATRVLDEPIELLVGPAHALADADGVTLSDLAAHPIWMPSLVAGTEWDAYYRDLARDFGLTIDTSGPNFGLEALLDAIAATTRATFVGEQTRMLWPDGHNLRRIPLHAPTPVYPHSLIWRTDNPHPGLHTLREHLGRVTSKPGTWVPDWVSR
ncbi:LysR family transcriptional regulator [Actinocrispum sp. NPDC049592]|uniref:LysR family transcriptional regulator n=1 Tax=Actinocrispum sp. NPDC049592 TaxID=3154835 RepID=UPI0034331C57